MNPTETRPSDTAMAQCAPVPRQPGASALPRRPVHDALDLTAGGALADIRLHGQVYSLRITRAGKLILTK